MAKRLKHRLTLAEILHSLSEDFYPEGLGNTPVRINSRRSDGDAPLHIMAHTGNTHALKLLIEAGADVNAVGDMSETPLHIVLQKEDLASATALVEAGASPYFVSEFDQSPLDIAKDLGGSFQRLLLNG